MLAKKKNNNSDYFSSEAFSAAALLQHTNTFTFVYIMLNVVPFCSTHSFRFVFFKLNQVKSNRCKFKEVWVTFFTHHPAWTLFFSSLLHPMFSWIVDSKSLKSCTFGTSSPYSLTAPSSHSHTCSLFSP